MFVFITSTVSVLDSFLNVSRPLYIRLIQNFHPFYQSKRNQRIIRELLVNCGLVCFMKAFKLT